MGKSNGAKVLSFEDIEAADDLGVEEIDIPEWGGVLKVRPLTGLELEQVGKDVAGQTGLRNYNKMLGLSLIEPKLTAEQIDFLWTKHNKAVRRIVAGLDRINKLSEEAVEATKANFPEQPVA